MIVAQVTRTIQSLERAEQLKKVQSEHDHLRATLDELQRVDQALGELVSVHATVQDCLAGDVRDDYQLRFRELLEAFQQSRQQFQSERRQVESLRRIQRRIIRLRDQLNQVWYVTAYPQLDQYARLVALVRSLPEVREQLPDIDRLIEQLREQLNEAPSSLGARRRYEDDVKKLAGHLGTIEGLNDQVRGFLSKVAEGHASLADIDGEILRWCQQEGRASIFMISFRTA